MYMTKVSVIVVAYKNMQAVENCRQHLMTGYLDSKLASKLVIEFLVVDNTHHNRGFGSGCNQGAKLATGDWLLFLNPDTQITAAAIAKMVAIMESDDKIGLLGPKMTDENGREYLSCAKKARGWQLIWLHSVLNSWFKNLGFIRSHWFNWQPPKKETVVGTVSGAAMMMSREVFDQVGGFDEQYFLYWEEADLCYRVMNLGKKIVFTPEVEIVHIGATSTPSHSRQILAHFQASRNRFFTKHYGWKGTISDLFIYLTESWRLMATMVLTAAIISGVYFSYIWLPSGLTSMLGEVLNMTGLVMQQWYLLAVIGSIGLVAVIFEETKSLSYLKSGLLAIGLAAVSPLLLIWLPLSLIMIVGYMVGDLLKWKRVATLTYKLTAGLIAVAGLFSISNLPLSSSDRLKIAAEAANYSPKYVTSVVAYEDDMLAANFSLFKKISPTGSVLLLANNEQAKSLINMATIRLSNDWVLVWTKSE
jgi:GT2 family glycosyltransferase